MLDSVLNTIKKYNMISRNDRIVAAVSGGPDSMALLHMLYCLRDEYSLYIHVAHLNHMLRGQESDEDTEYVKNFCMQYNIPCTVEYVDINRISREMGLSHEEAGRKARYDMFERVAKKVGAEKIALAHNMNDQAETILMRIMRGTGLDGLCGIKPVRDGIYIRPLINTDRKDIEEYCRINNLKPRIDSTNLMPVYARNKIRLEVIPFIKENYNANIERVLSSMAEILCEDNDFLNQYAHNIYMTLTNINKDRVSIKVDDFKNLHNAIKKRVIREAVKNVKGNLIGIESKHVDLVLSITDDPYTGAAVEMPGGIRARISYGFLNIEKVKGQPICQYEYNLTIPGSLHLKEIDGNISLEIIDNKLSNLKSNNKFIKYFDYDKIKDNLVVRNRRAGDYIVPFGMKGRKKIKDFFIDSKVPREQRNMIPLLASGSEIIWIVGYIINDNYKISINTNKVLKAEFKQSRRNYNV